MCYNILTLIFCFTEFAKKTTTLLKKMNGTIEKRRFCLLKQSFYFKCLSLLFFNNLDLILLIKVREGRRATYSP